MNTINLVDIKYLRSSRTIEKIELSNLLQKSTCCIYNYEGYHFRCFESETALNLFFQQNKEPEFAFDSEEELDEFLLYHYSSF